MNLKSAFFFIIFISWGQLLQAQIDSIEYNLFEQIYDFEIFKNNYYFKTWDGKIIEKDTLLFDANRFFNNFPNDYKPGSFDSVQFAIIARTLKTSYKEEVLYNKQNDFIRICWLKGNYPVIIKFEELKKENIKLSVKIGDGNYERHGKIIQESTINLNKRNSKKIHQVIDAKTYKSLRNGVICPEQSIFLNVFYFEYRNGEDESIIVIGECNLKASVYKNVFKLFLIAKAICEKEKLFSKAYWL